jgi:hypothetical protein
MRNYSSVLTIAVDHSKLDQMQATIVVRQRGSRNESRIQISSPATIIFLAMELLQLLYIVQALHGRLT